MRILHTADWHIGHRLHDHERYEEHQVFLDWLLEVIETHRVDLLVVAGDIFDNGYPTHEAQTQYYHFLRGLAQTYCRNTVIVGGNHDYPGTLNAPRDILALLNIKVIGKAFKEPKNQIIRIQDRQQKPQALVCAVPYLRDKDIRDAVAGETYEQIEDRVREGILKHYHVISTETAPFKAELPHVPVIATGHLFAQGGQPSDPDNIRECSEKPIHIGTLGNICAADFPAAFDYVALGHLHRPQRVNQQEHIRYSGSPLPLSFSEFKDEKSVFLLDFDSGKLAGATPVAVPCARRLVRFRGSFEKIAEDLAAFDDTRDPMRVWAEVKVELTQYEPNLVQRIQELVKDRNIAVLKHQAVYDRTRLTLDEQIGLGQALHELSPEEIFRKKCESEKVSDDDYPKMLATFHELLETMETEETKEVKSEKQTVTVEE